MTDPELMSIGAFAKRSALTPSALRFYDDAGLIQPELVDAATGYRFYSESQLVRASQLRQLRELGMPLATIGTFFASDIEEAARLIDDRVAEIADDAASMRQAAATLKASLGEKPRLFLCELPGPVLAAALDQVIPTTVHDSETPVLEGVRLEVDPGGIVLTTTDRYRLAMRTLVPDYPAAGSWAGTLSGEDLRAGLSRLRRSPRVVLEAGDRTLDLRLTDGTAAHCRLLPQDFPDFRFLIGSLPKVTNRVNVETHQVLKALEQQAPEKVGLRIASGQLSLLVTNNALRLNGSATGPDVTLWFELTTLYPVLNHALGTDLMIDLRGSDQPATVRSADDGDLTTLVMPCRHSDPAHGHITP